MNWAVLLTKHGHICSQSSVKGEVAALWPLWTQVTVNQYGYVGANTVDVKEHVKVEVDVLDCPSQLVCTVYVK